MEKQKIVSNFYTVVISIIRPFRHLAVIGLMTPIWISPSGFQDNQTIMVE